MADISQLRTEDGLTFVKNPERERILVIIVPFSHNDAAWLLTFEEYFERKTKQILDNIVNILPELEDMTFVWSEVCFLQYWWDRSSEQYRDTLKHLVNTGKLQIVTGGWVMPDEATTNVFSLTNQLIEGHQWIWENIGIIPEYSWSIDPFGCSSVMAYLLSISGINGLIIQRIHYSWKRFFSEQSVLDVMWKQDFEAPLLKLRIQPTPGYTVTDSCGPAKGLCQYYDFNKEISNFEEITFGNIHRKAEVMLGLYGRMGSLSESNVVLVTLGGDFRFENESEWFQQYRNYKALMDYINSIKSYKAVIHFGTLKDYFNQAARPNVTLQGDFFPYADLNPDNSLAYWTGYYSTRPSWKKLSRNLESMLRSTEILYTLTFNLDSITSKKSKKLVKQFKKLIRARRNTALFQHHDGITGTSKARVMDDYKSKMVRSLNDLKKVMKLCMETIMMGDEIINFAASNGTLLRKLLLFNNLPYYRSEAITIRTDFPSLIVFDSKKNVIQSQVTLCFDDILVSSRNIQSKRYELTFIYTLPPFSISVYEIHSSEIFYNQTNYINCDGRNNKVDRLFIINNNQKIFFSENGLLKSIVKSFGSINLISNLKAYTSEEGNSGAYLFRPAKETVNVFSELPDDGEILFIDGSVYNEVRAVYEKGYSVSTRVYGSDSDLNEVVEMKISYNISEYDRELFIEFVTTLKGTKFFTDVNSLEMRERVRISYQDTEGNYYPITNIVYLENTDYRFAIITDHSHGAASLEDGSIEIMLDRRISVDDRRGLEEPLDDRLQTTSTLYIVFQKSGPDTIEILSKLAVQLNNPAPIQVTSAEMPVRTMSLINKPLPPHINILNFRTLSTSNEPTSTALLVLQNLGSSNNTNTFEKDTRFKNLNIRRIFKTSLTGLRDEEEIDELEDIKVKLFNILSLKVIF